MSEVQILLLLLLSGYLIYKTSVWDLEHGEYAAGRFYKKRCIRIYPPLLIMIIAVWGILAVSMPEVAKGKGGEVLSVVGGYNNFWQIRQNASYFARMSQQSPYTLLEMFADEILCALILLLISVGSTGKWLDKSPFALVGRISYELYLWMYPMEYI